jgi:hypothetical protein
VTQVPGPHPAIQGFSDFPGCPVFRTMQA